MPAQSPAAALSLLDQGDLAAARELVAQALAMRLEADAARAWARVAEAGGFSLLAVQAWQAVLAGGAADVEALEALVPLHEARGDERRARACQQRLADLGRGPRPTSAVEAPEGAPEPLAGEPEPGDLVRFCHRLGGRAGVHARQWWEAGRGGEPGRGGYSPVQSPLSPELVAAHLAGGMTLGVYIVRHDDTVGQLIFDLDARKSAVEAAWGDPERARGLRERIHRAGLSLLSGLRRAGFDPLLVDSGYKGRHLWCLFPRPVPAAVARGLGLAWVRALAPADPDLVVEVFPRQDKVPAGGLGNLVKLPLGLHRRTDRRCHILDDAGAPVADPWARLRQLRAVDPSAIAAPGEPLAPTPSPLPAEAPLPAPAPVGASPFTEADFEARPRLASVLAGCPVLRLVVDRALREKDLPGAAHNVLEHSLGHLPEGVEAINYLVRHAGQGEAEMKRPHRGAPVSCARVRQHLPGVVERVPCQCQFKGNHGYAHPLLHMGVARPADPEAAGRSLEELLDALGRTEARLTRLQKERDQLRRVAADRLSLLPGGRFEAIDGAWWVEDEEGIPVVRFSPRPGAEPRGEE